MVDYSSIFNTLSLLDIEYGRATGVALPLLFSKLAVIEFCGWIEESFDTLCRDYISSCIVNVDNQNKIESAIKKNYGFSYDMNVYPMMCRVFGINNLENILDSFPPVHYNNMVSLLATYTNQRNRAAHVNTIIGVTPAYLAPSAVISDYNKIKPAFQYLESAISAL